MDQSEVQDSKLRAKRRFGMDKRPLGFKCCLGLYPTAPELPAFQANFVYVYLKAPNFPGGQCDS